MDEEYRKRIIKETENYESIIRVMLTISIVFLASSIIFSLYFVPFLEGTIAFLAGAFIIERIKRDAERKISVGFVLDEISEINKKLKDENET